MGEHALTGDKWKAKLVECKKTGRLNLSLLELVELPAGFTNQVKVMGGEVFFGWKGRGK